MNPAVDFYFRKAKTWQPELRALRSIILETHLQEELKWGVPCYTYNGKNIVLIHDFKEYCAVLFFKGALLKDPHNILVQQTEHVQSARQIRFTGKDEVLAREEALQSYIFEAVRIEEAGLKVPAKKTADFAVPDEFRRRLDQTPALKMAFEALTPGRQRGYLLHFSSAKRPETREARIEKHLQKILDGKGLDD